MKNKLVLVTMLLGGLVASCSKTAQQGQQKRVAPYKVIELNKTSTTLLEEYPATLEGMMDIDIRPKIDGYIEKVFVDEGEVVRKGQALFKIDNPQYEQDLQNLGAAVASAKAAVANAELQVRKTQPLVERKIVSDFELETAKLDLQAKKAELQQAEAKYSNAKTNVGYTLVESPVNGLVGSLPYRIGSYVSNQTESPLTRISDISTIYAYFAINEKQQLDMMMNTEGKTLQEKIAKFPHVKFIMSNGVQYEESGKIETFSGQVSKETGSFNVRASFPNPKKLLHSGGSGVIQIPVKLNHVILIPQKATMELQDKRLALVVEADNKVKAVPIKVRPVPGGQFFVVDEGLKEKDKVVVEGVGILAEGTVIKPELVELKDAVSE